MTTEDTPIFTLVEDKHKQQAVIKVIGIGGGGSSAVAHMIRKGLTGIEFIVMNTDAQALRASPADLRLQLGVNITKGLGAGANPEVGYQSALENRDEIRKLLAGADVIFLAVGMGGGTGTGASPVVAELAKELGILTIAVVSKPSFFEGNKRINYANQGITQLSKHIDSLLTIPNDKLKKALPKGISFLDALSAANDVLYDAVRGFISIINDENGLINTDFADVNTVMKELGITALMGTGVVTAIETAEERAKEAVKNALACPLLEDAELSNARAILGHITSGSNFTLDEYEVVGEALHNIASNDARIIIGVTIDPDLDETELHVTVIVTGLGDVSLDDESLKIKSMHEEKTIINSDENKQESSLTISSENAYLNIPAFIRKKSS